MNITQALPGVEAQYTLTEKIIHELFPHKSNHPSSSQLRCNKHEIQLALKNEGKPYIKQIIIDPNTNALQENIKKITAFSKQHHDQIIIKPASESAASADLLKPHSAQEIQHYL